MSAFLGKIHYWLFNKILWFENLEDEIIELCRKENLNVEELKNNIEAKYGEKLPDDNLENIIDHNNIHGWLQSKIHAAEGRMVAYTKVLINNGKDSEEKIKEVYIHQAEKAAEEVKQKLSADNAQEIYNEVNNYILDGMPCDRVNEILQNTPDKVLWTRRICVHKDIWNAEDVNVDTFYDFRNAWIETFVKNLNSDFRYIVNENNFSIERI